MADTADEATWLSARIAKTRTMIEACEDAITAISGGAQSYQLDTGQTRQLVTKANVSSVRTLLSELENRLAVLNQRLNGGGTSIARPGF